MAEEQKKSQNQVMTFDAKLAEVKNVRDMFSIPDVKERFVKNYEAVSGKKDGENRFEQEKFAYMEILNDKPELKSAPIFYHFASIVTAGTTGLSFRNQRLYVMPIIKDSKVVGLKVESSPAGKREMMENMTTVKKFPEAILVMKGDNFVHDKLNNIVKVHETTKESTEDIKLENIRASYQRIYWADNTIEDVVVYKDDLFKAKSKSKIKKEDAGVWNEFPGEAAKKTATNRAFNRYYKNPDNVVEYDPQTEDTTDITHAVMDEPTKPETAQVEHVDEDTGEVTDTQAEIITPREKKRAPNLLDD